MISTVMGHWYQVQHAMAANIMMFDLEESQSITNVIT